MRTRNPAGHKPKKRKQQKGNGLHPPTQEAEDQPRAPERDADDDAVADEPVQPRRRGGKTDQAPAYERAHRVHPLV